MEKTDDVPFLQYGATQHRMHRYCDSWILCFPANLLDWQVGDEAVDDRTCTTVSYSNLEMKDCMRARCARAEKLEKGAGWSLWIIVR